MGAHYPAEGAPNGAPIFIVGSPRSGTSVLTWCLGQHPHIAVQEESGWIGEFAVDVGTKFKIGSSRGERSQLSALGIERGEFFKELGDATDRMIVRASNRVQYPSNTIAAEAHESTSTDHSPSAEPVPKIRWVDGTPEYSLYICGLKKLFPGAKFIHIVRDVESVVRSLLHFRNEDNGLLVHTEQEAYEYWTRTVEACLQAEQALGPECIFRLRYDELICEPPASLGKVLAFLGEPFDNRCVQPLKQRMNSSNVPARFNAHDSATKAETVEHALTLSQFMQNPMTIAVPNGVAHAAFEESFDARIEFVSGIQHELDLAQRASKQNQEHINALRRRLTICGWMLACYLAMTSLSVWQERLSPAIDVTSGPKLLVPLLVSAAGMLVYLFMRRSGLKNIVAKTASRATGFFQWLRAGDPPK